MKAIILTASLLLASGAQAAETEFYIGAGGGLSHGSLGCQDMASCQDKDAGFKLFAGLKALPHLNVELGYTDFGQAKASDPAGPDVNARANDYYLAAVGYANLIDQVRGFVKLGAASVNTRVSVDGVGYNNTKTTMYWGVGVDLAVTPVTTVSAFMDGTHAQGQTPEASLDASLRLYGVSLQYAF